MAFASTEDVEDAAKSAYESGDLKRAEALLIEALARMDADPYDQANLGLVRWRLGDYAGAIAAYSQLDRLGPDDLCNRGLSFENLGDLDSARADYESALGVQPDFADVMVNLGTLELSAGNHSRAMDLLQRAATLDPTANWALSDALLEAGDARGAEEALREAIRAGEPRALLDLAALLVSDGRLSEAEDSYRQAVAAGVNGAVEELRDYVDGRCGSRGA
jgi:tetratricopeptide (TPR) repeat protein